MNSWRAGDVTAVLVDLAAAALLTAVACVLVTVPCQSNGDFEVVL